jgi:hypothetical protein
VTFLFLMAALFSMLALRRQAKSRENKTAGHPEVTVEFSSGPL